MSPVSLSCQSWLHLDSLDTWKHFSEPSKVEVGAYSSLPGKEELGRRLTQTAPKPHNSHHLTRHWRISTYKLLFRSKTFRDVIHSPTAFDEDQSIQKMSKIGGRRWTCARWRSKRMGCSILGPTYGSPLPLASVSFYLSLISSFLSFQYRTLLAHCRIDLSTT